LKVLNLGTLLSDTFSLFFDNFVTLVVLNLIPLVPMIAFGVIIGLIALAGGMLSPGAGSKGLQAVGVGMMVLFGLALLLMLPVLIYVQVFCQAAQTFAVAEAVNGRKPAIGECLKRVDYWLPVRLFITMLLPGILSLAAFIPAGIFIAIAIAKNSIPFGVIGGIMAVMTVPLLFYLVTLFMFAQPVVVLEKVWLIEALQRSMDLGRGLRLRNLGVMIVVGLVIIVPLMMVNVISAFIPCLGNIVGLAVQIVAAPLFMVPLILLYYDNLLRKSGGEARPY
jgi:hypothetical protein